MHSFSLQQEMFIQCEITEDMVQKFIDLSGDTAPLHTNLDFALQHGFQKKVVHGALLFSQVSKFVGLHLPGPRSIWMKADVKFHHPCYAPSKIFISGKITSLSEAMSSLIIDITMTDELKKTLVTCKSYHKILNEVTK